MSKDVQSRKWLITANNPEGAEQCESDDDYKDYLTEWVETRRAKFQSISYVACQFEKVSCLHI